MLAHLSAAKAIDALHETVQELAVVADHDDSAVEGRDGLLQHVLGLHVEMVCGLVEDEEVHGLQQQLNHRQT